MSRNQVSEWFGNMRRRIRDANKGLQLTWEEKVKRYNDIISGKSDPLPIMPGDTIAEQNNNETELLNSNH
ncbi:hypothetical protein Anas_07435 [Armadillidium nasatum]|uniref:Homeobox domain-containing protein n=1 Tax=Armadillidium nasatum TaxID=96803 RepID=A0A5N5SVN3_9CRUS|nr:hypothetical protein Anas_07435 [Armadillidium nasatum]